MQDSLRCLGSTREICYRFARNLSNIFEMSVTRKCETSVMVDPRTVDVLKFGRFNSTEAAAPAVGISNRRQHTRATVVMLERRHILHIDSHIEGSLRGDSPRFQWRTVDPTLDKICGAIGPQHTWKTTSCDCEDIFLATYGRFFFKNQMISACAISVHPLGWALPSLPALLQWSFQSTVDTCVMLQTNSKMRKNEEKCAEVHSVFEPLLNCRNCWFLKVWAQWHIFKGYSLDGCLFFFPLSADEIKWRTITTTPSTRCTFCLDRGAFDPALTLEWLAVVLWMTLSVLHRRDIPG